MLLFGKTNLPPPHETDFVEKEGKKEEREPERLPLFIEEPPSIEGNEPDEQDYTIKF